MVVAARVPINLCAERRQENFEDEHGLKLDTCIFEKLLLLLHLRYR